MGVLIVSSYHADWEPKIGPVQEMVGRLVEFETVSDVDISPEFNLTGYQALVLSGSPNLISKNEYLPRYVEFLRRLALPVLGICYGHQLLARSHGARVLDSGRMLEGEFPVRIIEPRPLFLGLEDEISVHESHREFVVLDDLEKAGFDLLANSSDCSVEAIRHRQKPAFGVQFHIERSGMVGNLVMENFLKFAEEWKEVECRDG